jgi:ABC-type sugar transport system permease subunit
MFLPGIIPSMAGMMLWKQGIFAADGGVLNQIVEFFGGKPVNWLINEQWSRWSLLFMGFPFVGGYLIFYGGMINIPGEYHEAGRLEGLGAWKRLFCIDIPLIMPQIKYIFVMTIIDSVQNYSRTYVMKSSGTKTLAEGLYRAMQDQTDYGLSSAYAMLIFACLFMAIAANFKMQKKDTMGDGL